MSAIAADIVQRFDQLKSERGTWESHWEEIAARVLPRYKDNFQSIAAMNTKGEKKTNEMYDATAALGLERFAAAMESMLTPRNQRWHRLRPTDPDLFKMRDVRLWFEQATDVLFKHRYAPQANFASQQHENYIGLGAFGTGAIFVDAHSDGGLRYQAINLAEMLFDLNHQGVVDTSFRKFFMTARQLKQRQDLGLFNQLPENVTSQMEKHPDRKFEVIHCIKPNENLDTTRSDARGMKFSSYYILVEGQHELSMNGYHTFRYAVSRYVTGPGEIYGRSPAMLALPAIKVLNEQKKTMLKQGHRVVDPVLLVHDDGVLDTFSLRPGSLNPGGVNAQGQRMIHELPTGNLAAGQELMDMERGVINEAFLVNLFQILVETPQMTATEVLERAREKGALLSPTMGRQQSEGLGPTIEAELDILARQGLLPPMPQVMIEAGSEFEIEYDSPLSRSQRAEEAAGYLRTFESASLMAQTTGDLSPLDWFNQDVIIPKLADINAVPASWMQDQDTVTKIRQGRAEAQEKQQALDAAPGMAGMIKAVGE